MKKFLVALISVVSIVTLFVVITFSAKNSASNSQVLETTVHPAVVRPLLTVDALIVEEKVVVNRLNSGGLNLTLGKIPGTGSFSAIVKTTKASEVKLEIVRNPSRIVLDFIGDSSGINQVIDFKTKILKQVRSGKHSDKTRLVFDVDESISDKDITLQFSEGHAILIVIK
ncbi:MAG: hypothetical protein DRQ39_11530 [Gammaproteobacteria bacterium]|nr:MAG: hypothetical protein DRQ39_11530 [Gammaproteobacteria bacterium]